MTDPLGSRSPFAVHASGEIIRGLIRLQRRATCQGRGLQVLQAMREIIRRLEQDPDEAGELLYRLPALRLRVCSVSVKPMVVTFAVSEEQPLVFIKAVHLLSKRHS